MYEVVNIKWRHLPCLAEVHLHKILLVLEQLAPALVGHSRNRLLLRDFHGFDVMSHGATASTALPVVGAGSSNLSIFTWVFGSHFRKLVDRFNRPRLENLSGCPGASCSRSAVFTPGVLSFSSHYRVVEAYAGEQAILEVDESCQRVGHWHKARLWSKHGCPGWTNNKTLCRHSLQNLSQTTFLGRRLLWQVRSFCSFMRLVWRTTIFQVNRISSADQ